MSFLDTKSPLILLHRDLEMLPDIPRYDLMLSPQFYVLKREELPIKYAFQAKKLAPSILDELACDSTLTYEVFRDGDFWVFVGYDQQKLAEFLDTKGGSIDKVGQIYFAEQAKENFENPIELNEKEVLAVVNDTVTVVPKQLLGEGEELVGFDDSFRPDKSFRVQRNYSSVITTSQAATLAVLLAILAIAYFAEGYRYHRALIAADDKLENLLDDNPSLRGAYARESIHKKYLALDKEQRAIRERLKAVSRMTGKKIKIDSLMINKNGYKVTLDIPEDPKVVKSLRTIAKDANFGKLNIKGSKLESEGSFQ